MALDPPSFRRPCIECGKIHDTGFQNMSTGAMIERFDKCYECYMDELYKKCKAHWDTAKIDINWTEKELKEWANERRTS